MGLSGAEITSLALEVSLLTKTGLDYLLGLSLGEFKRLLRIIISRQKRREHYGKQGY